MANEAKPDPMKERVFCSKCGAQNEAGRTLCSVCGATLLYAPRADAPTPPVAYLTEAPMMPVAPPPTSQPTPAPQPMSVSYPPAPRHVAPHGVMMTAKDPNTAFLIEFVGGIFGLLGLGYMYAGRTGDGVTRLIVWLIADTIMWLVVLALISVIIGLCLAPLALAAVIFVAYTSANGLKRQMMADIAAAASL